MEEARLGVAFAFIFAWGFGGVFSIRKRTSSSLLRLLGMSGDPFSSAFLKVERAKHHIADLNGKMNAYLSQQPFALYIMQYPELAERHLTIKTEVPIPVDFPLVIGDAIHNLRASLDVMIFGMIGHLVQSPETLTFPFAKDADRLKSTIAGREMQLAGEGVVAEINALEPYPDGKYGLHALHELDISDKHRLILPVGKVPFMKLDDLRKADPVIAERIMPNPDLTLGFLQDTEAPVLFVVRIDSPAHTIRQIQKKSEIQPTFSISFRQGTPVAHKGVIETLNRFVSSCEHAIRAIRDVAE